MTKVYVNVGNIHIECVATKDTDKNQYTITNTNGVKHYKFNMIGDLMVLIPRGHLMHNSNTNEVYIGVNDVLKCLKYRKERSKHLRYENIDIEITAIEKGKEIIFLDQSQNH